MEKQKVDKIITEYLNKIYGFAFKKSFTYTEVEDLCSDIITEVYTSLLKSGEIENVEGYIWRISEHTYAKYVSRKKKQSGVSIDNMILPHYDEYFFDKDDEERDLLRREIAFLSEVRRRTYRPFSKYSKRRRYHSSFANVGWGKCAGYYCPHYRLLRFYKLRRIPFVVHGGQFDVRKSKCKQSRI